MNFHGRYDESNSSRLSFQVTESSPFDCFPTMTNSGHPVHVSNRVAILVILVSGIFSLLWSIGPGSTGTPDFRALYYGARCVESGENPYSQDVYLARYKVESNEFPSRPKDQQDFLQAIPICVNPPTTLMFAVPFTWMGWKVASFIWLLIQFVSISLGAFLAWKFSCEYAPRMSLALVAMLMANCESLFKLGNVSASVIGWCIFAFWSARVKRFETAGVIALSLGLILKPQLAGVIWMFGLLLDGHLRKRAVQALAIATVIFIFSIAWIRPASPHWLHDWRANMAQTAAPGQLNNPAPALNKSHGVNTIISLQAVFAEINDNPHFYDIASGTVCALLLMTWFYFFRKMPNSEIRLWIGLASFIPLAILPIYHRQYDAKLLLLALPACALLWSKAHPYRQSALYLTIAVFIVSADIPYSIIVILSRKLSPSGLLGGLQPLLVLIDNPIPICMLILGTFYLWLLARESRVKEAAA